MEAGRGVNLLEAIRPNSPICDETWRQWLFIAGRAYEDGEYSYERDKGSELYLKNAVDWILENAGEDGLWDWGPRSGIHGDIMDIFPVIKNISTIGWLIVQLKY